MNLYLIAAGAAVLTAALAMGLSWPVWMWLLGFVVCFGAVALGVFAAMGGGLFRSLGAAAAFTGALGAVLAPGGSLWTFVWVFFLTDVALIAVALGFLCWVCAKVDLEEPQKDEDDKFYRSVMDVYIRALMDLVLITAHYEGLEKTPKDGRFLLVCNHLCLADPGILLNAFRKSQLAFITKQENMSMPIINKFMHKILCQSLDRDDDRQALKVILRCIQLVKNDTVSMGVFPEGTRSRDGKLHHFRGGVFKIAQKANVPIVVCTLRNTRELFHNLKRLKRTQVYLKLVDVIPAEDLKGKTAVQISQQVYEMMIADLGEQCRPVAEETT